MSVRLTIRATLNEEVIDGVGVPQSVTVTGAGFLTPSAITDIAQEVLDSAFGGFSDYVAMRPDTEFVSDEIKIKVVNRHL